MLPTLAFLARSSITLTLFLLRKFGNVWKNVKKLEFLNMWLLLLNYSKVELATLQFILEGGWRKLVTWACFLGWDWDHSTTNTTLQTWRLPFSNSIFYAITCCTTLLILHVWRNWANVQKLEVIHHLSTLGWMRKLEKRRRFFASPHKYEPVNHLPFFGLSKEQFLFVVSFGV